MCQAVNRIKNPQAELFVRQRERPGLPSQALAWPPRLSTPTPTCRLQISFSFRAARCSLPCVLITITLRPGKVKREHRDPLPRVLHQDPEAWEFYPGERKQELASQIHLPPWEAVFNCSLKSLSKLFKVLSAHSGKFCWAPRAAVVSSLLSITGAATLGRVPIFHCLPGMVPHRQLT